MLEILAPCGSPEALEAALNAGADAVYLGLSSFSARRNAVNFGFEELKNGVKKAHRRGVKVYAAINTLVFDDEIKELEKAINEAREAGGQRGYSSRSRRGKNNQSNCARA